MQIPDLCLDVKVMVQPLGTENQWSELGEGRCEFHGYSVRVVNYDAITNHIEPREAPADEEGEGPSGSGNNPNDDSELYPPQPSPQIVIEDGISDETPFVGENSCIVWNSLDQQLSMCLMFSTDQGFAAAWSALHALQHKPYPPLGVDFLALCRDAEHKKEAESPSGMTDSPDRESEERGVEGNNNSQSEAPPPPPPLLYSNVIHQHYVPPLGYIEKHALALSVMEFDHGAEPALFTNLHTCVTLLKLCHPDLVEYLTSEQIFPQLLKGLESEEVPPSWTVPSGLNAILGDDVKETGGMTNVELVGSINASLRLHFLKHEVLPVGTDEEVIAVIDSVQHRLHNEVLCSILSDEKTLPAVVSVLANTLPHGTQKDTPVATTTSPPGSAGGSKPPKPSKKDRKGTPDTPDGSSAEKSPHPPPVSSSSDGGRPVSSSSHRSNSRSGSHPPLYIPAAVDPVAEATVATHLHFLSSFYHLAVGAFSKELLNHLTTKLFEAGLLEAMSLVCQRFLTPMPPPSAGGSSGGFDGTGTIPVPTAGTSPGPTPSDSGMNLTMTQPSAPVAVTETQIPSDISSAKPPSSGRPPSQQLSSRAARVARQSGGGSYSAVVETHLVTLLDQTLVKLNEKGEEGMLNDIFRGPILASPDKFAPLMLFLTRNLIKDPSLFIGRNPLLLYHLLGMHDDEGSTCERDMEPQVVEARQVFQLHIIETVVKDVCRGKILPILSAQSVSPRPTSTSPGLDGPRASSQEGTRPSGTATNNDSFPSSEALWSAQNQRESLGKVPPTFIRLLEYLMMLTSLKGREALTAIVVHPKSYVMRSVEMDAALYLSSKGPSAGGSGSSKGGAPKLRIENLTGNLRFLRALMQHGGPPAMRCVTVDKDVLRPYLLLYMRLGGPRKRSLFHSTVLSLLQMLRIRSDTSDAVKYLMLKHRSVLPESFVENVEGDALRDLTARIQGIDAGVQLTPLPSRAATPLVNQAVIVDRSPSPNNRNISADEVRGPMTSPDAMEDIAAFPPRLRQMIGRMSPAKPNDGGSASSQSGSMSPQERLLSLSPPPKSLDPELSSAAGSGKKDGAVKQPKKPSAPSSGAKSGRPSRDSSTKPSGSGSSNNPSPNSSSGRKVLKNIS